MSNLRQERTAKDSSPKPDSTRAYAWRAFIVVFFGLWLSVGGWLALEVLQ